MVNLVAFWHQSLDRVPIFQYRMPIMNRIISCHSTIVFPGTCSSNSLCSLGWGWFVSSGGSGQTSHNWLWFGGSPNSCEYLSFVVIDRTIFLGQFCPRGERFNEINECYLRDSKHFYCTVFLSSYRKTCVSLGEWEMLWENERQASVYTAFLVLANFHECFCNLTETHRACFLFLLENSVTKKGNQLVNFDYQNVYSLCSCHH